MRNVHNAGFMDVVTSQNWLYLDTCDLNKNDESSCLEEGVLFSEFNVYTKAFPIAHHIKRNVRSQMSLVKWILFQREVVRLSVSWKIVKEIKIFLTIQNLLQKSKKLKNFDFSSKTDTQQYKARDQYIY